MKVSDEPSGSPRDARPELRRIRSTRSVSQGLPKGASVHQPIASPKLSITQAENLGVYRLMNLWCLGVILRLQLDISRRISVQTRSNFISHLPRPFPGLRRESFRIDFLVSGLIKSRRPGSQGYMRRVKV